MRQSSHLFLSTALLFALTCLGIQRSPGEDLVTNGDFENGTGGWTLFVPDESKDKNCLFDIVSTSPHSGTSCAHFKSDDYARFGISPATGIPVAAGEHYRVTAWVRADPAALVRAKSPGFVIRLNLREGGADATGGPFYIEPGNVVSRDKPTDSFTALPKEWTKVEAVIEIPNGVDTVFPALFSWWVAGSIFVDDFSFEKVDTSSSSTDAGSPGGSAPTTNSSPNSPAAPNPENK